MLPERNFDALETQIGYTFSDRNLLQRVFIHRSALNENRQLGLENNERLEFLGDAVLELVVTEYLYLKYNKPEGELTNWRSALVRGQHLAEISENIGFGDLMYLSHGEAKSGGKAKQLILANAFEALIGAMFLDGGYEPIKQFIAKFVLVHLDTILQSGQHIDPKSQLQEITQEKHGITPNYKVLDEQGPDHQKIFTVGVYLNDKQIGTGQGNSKQLAQIQAAVAGIEYLNSENSKH
ncbi:MAG: ribonuclease III [Patescibacteria group bacterium]|jgi:ribonuclease-3